MLGLFAWKLQAAPLTGSAGEIHGLATAERGAEEHDQDGSVKLSRFAFKLAEQRALSALSLTQLQPL
jgi:hypothetical protein